jgi:hypothetical protein
MGGEHACISCQKSLENAWAPCSLFLVLVFRECLHNSDCQLGLLPSRQHRPDFGEDRCHRLLHSSCISIENPAHRGYNLVAENDAVGTIGRYRQRGQPSFMTDGTKDEVESDVHPVIVLY